MDEMIERVTNYFNQPEHCRYYVFLEEAFNGKASAVRIANKLRQEGFNVTLGNVMGFGYVELTVTRKEESN